MITGDFLGLQQEEIENNIETLGNTEHRTIIKNPRFPFSMLDICYVASHLMFDGSYRDKKGCYFFAYPNDFVDYHKQRLSLFGGVPMNFIEVENQLYFSYTLGYIASKLLEISDFRSLKVCLSDKFKKLAKDNIAFLNEFIKSMTIDEGAVDGNIRVELGNNEQFIYDIYEVVSSFYKLNKISSRHRFIHFKGVKNKYNYEQTSWTIVFSASCFKMLYENINPLPITYKQRNFQAIYTRQIRSWFKRKEGETKKLMVESLLQNPKSILELCLELNVGLSVIRSHLKGHPTYSDSLIKIGIVSKVGERVLQKGGFAKEDLFGIVDQEKARKYLL